MRKLSFPVGARIAAGLLLALVACPTLALPAAADAPSRRLIVKFHADGERALLECAARLEGRGESFESATRDRSPSLDEIRERYDVHGTRPLFRSADARPFAAQRRALSERLARRRARGGAGASAARVADAPTPDLAHVYTVEIGGDVPLEDAVQAFSDDPHVAWAQVDGLNDLDADPYLDGFGSWGQPYEDLWGLLRIRADEAWAISRGEGVVVAVVDTGLDYTHPDIAANVYVNPGEDLNGNGVVDPEDWNDVDDDGNGFVDDIRGFDFANSRDANGDGDYDDEEDVSDPDPWDDNGHGTHVSGTIAAVEGNGIGIAGVAPDARIMPLKGFPALGGGLDSVLWRAVLYAVENGARVVNTSWSCRFSCPRNPLAEEIVAIVHAFGGVIVTSAGNNQYDAALKSPENAYETITVGSSGQDDDLSRNFSNFGLVVDVMAPGGDPDLVGGPFIIGPNKNILSLRAFAAAPTTGLEVGDRYVRNGGTSMSTPHVAGVVALLLAREPELGFGQIRAALHLGAADLGAPGHDATFGAGRLDAVATLAAMGRSDADVAFTGPLPMEHVDPLAGPHPIGVRIAGRDVEGVTLSFGAGLAPTSWTDLVSLDDELGSSGDDHAQDFEWETEALADGAYTLRLRARLSGGSEVVDAHLPLSLERHGPVQLSQGPGRAPVASRGRVVYEAVDPDFLDRDLRIADIRSGEDHVLVDDAGDQRDADFDGNVLAFLDGPPGDLRAPIRACTVRGRRSPTCAPRTVSDAPAIRQRPAVNQGRLYWGEQVAGDTELLGCSWSRAGDGCLPSVFQGGPGSQRSPGAWGRTVAWLSSAAGPLRTEFCTLDPKSGTCPARPVVFDGAVFASPAVGDRLLAWEQFAQPTSEVWLCELDPDTGACPPRRITQRAMDSHPRLSGRRLVYAVEDEAGNAEIWLCKWDPVLERCPVQRLTGSATTQSLPDIDGDLVVWQDDRLGETHVFGLRLPTLWPVGARRVRAGDRLLVPLRAFHREHDAPRIAATLPDGDPVEAIGAHLSGRLDSGHAVLHWRPRTDQVGVHRIVLTAVSASGLLDQETIEVVVEPPRRTRPHGSPGGAWQRWLAGWLFVQR